MQISKISIKQYKEYLKLSYSRYMAGSCRKSGSFWVSLQLAKIRVEIIGDAHQQAFRWALNEFYKYRVIVEKFGDRFSED
jgi:hypothetical protein